MTRSGKEPTIFFSAGEPSGDLHGANLIDILRQSIPNLVCEGFGGPKMEAAGCHLHYPLCDLSVVGFLQVFRHLKTFFGLIGQVNRHFREHRPDAVVLIDYPGFNWWVARRARAHGIPVIYFVPPQLWAWASWRVRRMRRLVDKVLCTLPFEKPWYETRGVKAEYIGHPYFDELRQQRLDGLFIAHQQAQPGTIIGLLPGSRRQELENNVPTLLGAAQRIHARRPDTRFLMACLRPAHAEYINRQIETISPGSIGQLPTGFSRPDKLPIEVCIGRTPEVIHLAHSCVAVSGSVSLELLYRARPSVILYRVSRSGYYAYRLLKTCRFVSLVNLLADRSLFPEYVTHRCEARAASEHILHWLSDPVAHETLRGQLSSLCERVAEPGACERAASHILATLAEPSQQPRQAA